VKKTAEEGTNQEHYKHSSMQSIDHHPMVARVQHVTNQPSTTTTTTKSLLQKLKLKF
jgi:hypothetical protein